MSMIAKGTPSILLSSVLTVILAVVLALAAGPARAEEALSEPQKRAVEETIRAYLLAHPEVIVEAIDVLRQREVVAEQAQQATVIQDRAAELKRNKGTPFAGAADGDVTVVEFFDYRCGYCKRVLPMMQELLKSDPKIRYVFKEFPILGPESQLAARAALATWRMAPEKYLALHSALMEAKGELNENRVRELAAKVGIDAAKLGDAMADKAIDEELNLTMDLARGLGLTGTPAFVVGERLNPGALDLGKLRQMVESARKGQ